MTDNRLGNIGSILNSPQRPRLVPTEPAAEPTPAPRATADKPAKEKASPAPRRPTPAAESPTRRVPVRIRPSLRDRLELAVRNTPGATVTTVALDAIQHLHDQDRLTDAVTALQEEPQQEGLFRRSVRQAAQAKVTIELRVPADDLKTLDKLKEAAGAESRSHLITAALMLELPA